MHSMRGHERLHLSRRAGVPADDLSRLGLHDSMCAAAAGRQARSPCPRPMQHEQFDACGGSRQPKQCTSKKIIRVRSHVAALPEPSAWLWYCNPSPLWALWLVFVCKEGAGLASTHERA